MPISRYNYLAILAESSLFSSQVVTDALVNPPKPGDPSFDLYHKEMTEIITSLASKAKMVHERMNKIPGIQCNEIQGSMEAFPRVDIPKEAWNDARVRAKYIHVYMSRLHACTCMQLLL